MIFWRQKTNPSEAEREKREGKLMHPKGEPATEPPVEYDADIDPDLKHALEENEQELLDELDEEPAPAHTIADDYHEAEDLKDHTNEGGWLSRLVSGLSKSSAQITRNIGDLLTKSALDADALERLEEILIEADLGPKTAAKVIENFSAHRFADDAPEKEIRGALADSMAQILARAEKPLVFTKPKNGPFVILVCGVNGAGKTTTIGKMAKQAHDTAGHSVMIAAGDTFRAAAVEQLEEWARRARCAFYKKDVGADAGAVAFEAYEKAKKDGIDVLFIDTAGRLQNKANLMEELEKIIRVLKKQSEDLPHAALLVLDATTGQNAFEQVRVFQEMVNITGLAVTKLDGTAKGGVMVGLADRFGLPVHFIGVGEGVEDLQPFRAKEYARSLVGL